MAVPNIQTVDLVATIRDISPNPTSDVSFTFVDQSTGEKSELLAHKLVLACGSSVFMAQFYGSIKEKEDSIPVEDSSMTTFKVFLDILYNKKVLLKSMDYQLLGELFYLADKHLLDPLKDAIIEEVSTRKMVTEQVLEGAKVAETHAHLSKFSEALFEVCSSFLKDNPESALEMCDNEEVSEENSLPLHRLMARANRTKQKSTAPPAPNCSNCEHDPCLHEEQLTADNFVKGTSVCVYEIFPWSVVYKTVKLEGSRVTCVHISNNSTSRTRDIATLKFCCK
eukprot:GFUD01041162.1.p1 GENE.GFUD01041162.1~~GFUD01041162.1.p1  ORF type:complete len:281 (-),score=48.41 GFUD01041162.1:53-895(-)